MARIKMEIPDKILTTLSIPVRITDLNYGNHVGNDSIVSILHEARVQWLHVHGFTELDIDGTALIMGDLAVEFVNEVFYGDKLTIKVSAGEITRVSFDLYYSIHCQRQDVNLVVARAKTGMVCFDYVNRKVASVPASLKKILES